jgi:hypothetical protein
LNTRSPFGKGFKKPLYQNNVERQKEVILPLIEYLLKLTDVKGIPIYSTPRKTFVIGLLFFLYFIVRNIYVLCLLHKYIISYLYIVITTLKYLTKLVE